MSSLEVPTAELKCFFGKKGFHGRFFNIEAEVKITWLVLFSCQTKAHFGNSGRFYISQKLFVYC